MKCETSVLIAISIEISKIPLEVQYLEFTALFKMEIRLLSY